MNVAQQDPPLAGHCGLHCLAAGLAPSQNAIRLLNPGDRIGLVVDEPRLDGALSGVVVLPCEHGDRSEEAYFSPAARVKKLYRVQHK
jgi:hypothetical protein